MFVYLFLWVEPTRADSASDYELLIAEYIMRNAGLDEAQAGIKEGEISTTSDMQITPPLWQKVKRN